MTDNSTFNKQNNYENLKFYPIRTYTDIRDSYTDYLSSKGKSKQDIKNVRSAINSWRESLKLKEDSPVGTELSTDFELSLREYINNQTARRIKKSTYSSQVSHIKATRNFYLKQMKISSLPNEFGKRLEHLISINNYTARKFWEYHLTDLINYDNFLKWLSGQTLPRRTNILIVEEIERCLEVPGGTLTSTLTAYRIPRDPSNITKCGLKIREAKKQKYRVWTDALQREYNDFIYYKTSPTLPPGMERRKNSRWTGGDENNPPPTAGIVKNYLESFFGFCCLLPDSSDPTMRGLGMKKEDLSLSLLADAEVIEQFITVFHLKRSEGKYNGGTLRFIHFVISIFREKTGYLYQKPEFSGEKNIPTKTAEWQEKCLATRQRLLYLKDSIEHEKKSGGEKFGFGRDPQEPIKEILESERPIYLVIQMVKRMLGDVDKLKNQVKRQAVLFRDIILMAMLQANPLRLMMFSDMKLGQHLVKKKDGSWWLKFKRHEFKNRHSLKTDYQVRVAPNLWHLIERYVNDFRSKLPGSEISPQVFLSSCKPSDPKGGYELSPSAISLIISNRTRQYIAGCRGFRPHAFRHIVATDIIKSNPEFGYFLASKVLHDKLSTVEENYAHLKTSEFFEPYNRLFSEAWDASNLPKSESESSDLNENTQNSELNDKGIGDE